MLTNSQRASNGSVHFHCVAPTPSGIYPSLAAFRVKKVYVYSPLCQKGIGLSFQLESKCLYTGTWIASSTKQANDSRMCTTLFFVRFGLVTFLKRGKTHQTNLIVQCNAPP